MLLLPFKYLPFCVSRFSEMNDTRVSVQPTFRRLAFYMSAILLHSCRISVAGSVHCRSCCLRAVCACVCAQNVSVLQK